MKKFNLLLFLLVIFMQVSVQAQTGDAAFSDEKDVSELELNQATTAESAEKPLTSKELEEKKRIEQEAKLYAARQAVLKKLNFIEVNQAAVAAQIENFNASLEACRCGKAITDPNDERELAKLTVLEIRAYFIEKNINITKIYMTSLNACQK